MKTCALNPLESPLSACNYRLLNWSLSKQTTETPIFETRRTFSVIRRNDDLDNLDLDQEALEKYYRQTHVIPFVINPKNYSVTSHEACFRIQKQLLCLIGSDEILLNDPYYFDMCKEKFDAYRKRIIENHKASREQLERRRTRRCENINVTPDKKTWKKFFSTQCESECTIMDIDDESECEIFDYSSSECENEIYDNDYDENDYIPEKLLDLFRWAEKYIFEKLINRDFFKSERDKNDTTTDTANLLTQAQQKQSNILQKFSLFGKKSQINKSVINTEVVLPKTKDPRCACC